MEETIEIIQAPYSISHHAKDTIKGRVDKLYEATRVPANLELGI